MLLSRLCTLLLLCLILTCTTSCGNKGIPCPSPNGKSVKVQAKGAAGLQAIKVPMNKNGLVQKRKKFLFF